MHRAGHVDKDTEAFLSDWKKGSQYANTKLANVLFTYEAQRRLTPQGVQVAYIIPSRNIVQLVVTAHASHGWRCVGHVCSCPGKFC